MKKSFKVIISGGGTGGHIFPAISIADAIKEKMPDAEILFVGAEGRMEMEKVPAAGYKIITATLSADHLLLSAWRGLLAHRALCCPPIAPAMPSQKQVHLLTCPAPCTT